MKHPICAMKILWSVVDQLTTFCRLFAFMAFCERCAYEISSNELSIIVFKVKMFFIRVQLFFAWITFVAIFFQNVRLHWLWCESNRLSVTFCDSWAAFFANHQRFFSQTIQGQLFVTFVVKRTESFSLRFSSTVEYEMIGFLQWYRFLSSLLANGCLVVPGPNPTTSEFTTTTPALQYLE
jgi:hypothetical protein